jgi:hypothetical protein
MRKMERRAMDTNTTMRTGRENLVLGIGDIASEG